MSESEKPGAPIRENSCEHSCAQQPCHAHSAGLSGLKYCVAPRRRHSRPGRWVHVLMPAQAGRRCAGRLWRCACMHECACACALWRLWF